MATVNYSTDFPTMSTVANAPEASIVRTASEGYIVGGPAAGGVRVVRRLVDGFQTQLNATDVVELLDIDRIDLIPKA